MAKAGEWTYASLAGIFAKLDERKVVRPQLDIRKHAPGLLGVEVRLGGMAEGGEGC